MAVHMDAHRLARRQRIGVGRLDRPASADQALVTRQRRLSKLMLFWAFAIVFAVFGTAGFQRLGGGGAAPDPAAATVSIERSGSALRHSAPRTLQLVRVKRVIDGDTIEVSAGGEIERVRLFGVDAPEAGAACGDAATAQLAQLAGAFVRLMADERLQDAGGRQLRYLFTPDGESIDARLVSDGVARAWRLDGALRPQLLALEGEARIAGRGCLWDASG